MFIFVEGHYLICFIVPAFLSSHVTSQGQTFSQYMWEHVCMKLNPGQEDILGDFLLTDHTRVRQIIGRKTGPVLIEEQIRNVIDHWLSVAVPSPTWQQLVDGLRRLQYNAFCKELQENLKSHEIGENNLYKKCVSDFFFLV